MTFLWVIYVTVVVGSESRTKTDSVRKVGGNKCSGNQQYSTKVDICHPFVISNKDNNYSYHLLSICYCGQALYFLHNDFHSQMINLRSERSVS